jgi:hypothetical protein
MEVAFARSRRLPSGKSGSSALAGTRLERRARWPTGAAAARVHRCSKTSTRPFAAPLFAGVFGPRALPRLLQIDVSTSTALDHPNIPYQRNPWSGRLLFFDRSSPFDQCSRRRYAGSGAEDHRASTLPPGIAPARDFAPTPIASDTSCRGHCLSPCLEWTGRPTKPPARRTLARHAQRRAVRRLISAKRSGAHQPEGPSVARPFENGV